ncbi:MAG TPA: type I methionyl aminopeptidase [Nitrospinae bacterium]|nr:type I methionyl aminopeptidase [Nitrospinota bacterium]
MIILKSRHEIEKMKISNRIVVEVLEEIKKKIRVGVATIELDRLAESVILKKGGTPAFKGYRGYPNSLCISINEQVVHGIPSNRRLKDGDLVSIDLGVYHDGYYGDAAITVGAGEITPEAKRLLDATQKALYIGIEKARAGNHLSDISNAVQMYVEREGFSVVRAFVGHGIGTSLHEEPQVPNFGEAGKGPLLKSGMVLAIEPMVNAGVSDVEVLEDDWTVVTADGSLSAHFEHTVAVTDNGVEILTKI